MPALVAPFLAFALGVGLVLYAEAALKRYDELELRAARRVVLLFASLVFAPVTAYFVVFAGDWSLAYLGDASRVPSAVALVWILLSGAAAPAGFSAAIFAVKRRARRELVVLAAAPLAAAFVFVVALYPELRLDGTTLEVRGGFGTAPVAGSPLGWAILWMDAMLAAGVAVTARALSPSRAKAKTPALLPVVTAPREAEPSDTEAVASEPKRLLGQRGTRRTTKL